MLNFIQSKCQDKHTSDQGGRLGQSIGVGVFLFLLMLQSVPLLAQSILKGRITDADGEALPFASIHVKGTSTGVSANEKGDYQLELPPGRHEVVYQYVGFAGKNLEVNLGNQPLIQNVTLESAAYEIQDVVVLSGEEDPSYPIIREAIRRREGHRDAIRSYQCKAYIKGGIKAEFDTTNIFTKQIKEAVGTDGEGYLYLSESESEISIQRPDQRKEVMIASRVSGNSRGFSFNRFGILDFQESMVPFGRPMVNPIADNAFTYYRYILQRSFMDEDGREVHQIKVIPKRSDDPVFAGMIYILGDTYQFHSLDLFTKGSNTKIELLDSLFIQQTFVPLGVHRPILQQSLRFNFGILGISFNGQFTSITSEYQINPDFPEGYFNRDIMVVEAGSNEKDDTYWDDKRPIPLTIEEQVDYQVKDSLAVIYESKPYMDSLDRIANRFKMSDFIRGYTWRNSYDQRQFSVRPSLPGFNAIQGITLGATLAYSQSWREIPGRNLTLSGSYLYGTADLVHRFNVGGKWQGNAVDKRYITWQIGDELFDLNAENPFPAWYDAILLLGYRNSVKRYYGARYAEIKSGSELGKGWRTDIILRYEDRTTLSNRSSFSLNDNNQAFPANHDLGNEAWTARLADHSRFMGQWNLQWTPGQRYIRYPGQRFSMSTAFPRINFKYRGGVNPENFTSDFHFVGLGISKANQWNTIAGSWSYNIEGGHFLKSPTYFQDFQGFSGNPMIVYQDKGDLHLFRVLPAYTHSTPSTYFIVSQEWQDNSYIFDKIPLIKKLRWSALFRTAHLWTEEMGHHTELSAGIDNIGWGVVRPFQIHSVFVLEDGQYRGNYWRIGIKPIFSF
jgi:hypothetical protein